MAKIVQIKQQAQTLPDIAEWWGQGGMSVIAVVSLSKDTGKTAFAAHIAVQADRAGGGPVAMLDFSAGGDLAHWKQQRGKPLPEVRQSQFGRVRDDILRLKHERLYPLCILDLMGPDAAGTTHALATTQLAVVLSPPEGEALDKATVLAENIAAMGVPVRIVLAGMPAEQDFWDAKTFALRRRGLLIPAPFHQDKAVELAMSEGRTANETDPDGNAATGIARLWSLMRPILAAPAGPARRPGKPWARDVHVIAVAAPPGPMRASIAAHLAVRGGLDDDGYISAMLVSSVADGPLAEWVAKRKGRPPSLTIATTGMAAALREWPSVPVRRVCVVEIAPDDLQGAAEFRETIDQVVVPVLVPLAARTRLTERDFWPHRPIFIIVRGNDKSADVISARQAILKNEGLYGGTVSLGADMAQAFGEGSTITESRPDSRAARDIMELWANLRKLMRQN